MSPPLPISSCIIEDWFHGLYTMLIFIIIWTILSSRKHSTSKKMKMLLWVLPQYICSTMHAALNWVYYSQAINDNELPGGPGLLFSLTHLRVWIEATGDAFFCINILLADCLVVWRCWTIWGRNWIVVSIPILTTIGGAVLGGMSAANQVLALETKEPFTAAKRSASFVTQSTAYFALSIATSLFTTILITIRILLVQRHSKAVGLKRNRYNRLIEILVESAVLYSASMLAFLILDVTKNPNEFYGLNIHAQMAGIAPSLITLRVAAGLSRPSEEWENASLSGTRLSVSLRFAHSHGSSTLQAAGGANDDSTDDVGLDISPEKVV